MIGQIQSSEANYGVLRSFGPSGLTQEASMRVARAGNHHVEVQASAGANYIGPATSAHSPTDPPPETSNNSEAVMFLLFNTSFLMGEYPTSAELEIEFQDQYPTWTSTTYLDYEIRLLNWNAPLSPTVWLNPTEFSSLPLVATVRREQYGENHDAGSRPTLNIDSSSFMYFNSTGWTGIVIARESFAQDTMGIALSTRINWTGTARPRLRVLSSQAVAVEQPSWGRPGRVNSIFGVLDEPLQSLSTEMRSSALIRLPTVTSGFLRVTLDPGRVGGGAEIVHITHHAANSDTATIRRATEATTPRSHAAGTAWEHAPTVADYRLATLADVRPDIYVDGSTRTLVENPNYQPLSGNSARYVSGPSSVYADAPPPNPMPGTVFISRSGAFFDNLGRQI